MKKYSHKSGRYLAVQSMYGGYDVKFVEGYSDYDRLIYSTPPHLKDLIEESNDWTQLVEVPIGQYFSKDEIVQAATKASYSTLTSFRAQYAMKPGHIISAFVSKLYQYLPKK
jgi:hypothetical protein